MDVIPCFKLPPFLYLYNFKTRPSDADEAEVKAMEPKLNRLIDMALDLSEPSRTELIATLTATQKQLRVLLKYLAE